MSHIFTFPTHVGKLSNVCIEYYNKIICKCLWIIELYMDHILNTIQ